MSEAYSEEPIDSEQVKTLLEFGDDYWKSIGSHSDCANYSQFNSSSITVSIDYILKIIYRLERNYADDMGMCVCCARHTISFQNGSDYMSSFIFLNLKLYDSTTSNKSYFIRSLSLQIPSPP